MSSSVDRAYPYLVPPICAGVAIVPVFRDLMPKSAQQLGKIPNVSLREGVKEGIKASRTVGVLVGSQMILQGAVERNLTQNDGSLEAKLKSSAIVGFFSSPVVAIFNGQSMKWRALKSLRRLNSKQALAITVQESAFVGGISAADKLAAVMKSRFGDNKAVEYSAAFASGAMGSLVGHPANTALTRWQAGLKVTSARQLMWGSMRKARAVGAFSVLYRLGKEVLGH